MSIDHVASSKGPVVELKFIFIDVHEGPATQEIMLIYTLGEYYWDILPQYKEMLPEQVTLGGVYGGGRVSFSRERIKAYGNNSIFGTADPEKVRSSLERYIRDHELSCTLSISMGSWL